MTNAIKILQLDHAAGLPIPDYATAASAGADICAALPNGSVTLSPWQRRAIPTGLIIAMPNHIEAQVRPRSGLALNYGISIANAPGTIDADYRGEINIILINFSADNFVVEHGMRIAQIIFAEIIRPDFDLVEKLDRTDRHDGGFGSTGISNHGGK